MKSMGAFQECWHLCPSRPLLHAQGLLNKLFFSVILTLFTLHRIQENRSMPLEHDSQFCTLIQEELIKI